MPELEDAKVCQERKSCHCSCANDIYTDHHSTAIPTISIDSTEQTENQHGTSFCRSNNASFASHRLHSNPHHRYLIEIVTHSRKHLAEPEKSYVTESEYF